MKYPTVGEQVRVLNETGLHTVKAIHRGWKLPGTNIRLAAVVRLEDDRFLRLDQIITRHQKWITVYVIQVYYGNGWEDVTEEETRSEAVQRRKEYRENVQRPVRLIRRKEPNALYQK
jgi:hypothetical protein